MKRNHLGYRVGECHQKARLTDEQVRAMRREYLAYVRGYETMARKYGCGVSTARDICNYSTRPI